MLSIASARSRAQVEKCKEGESVKRNSASDTDVQGHQGRFNGWKSLSGQKCHRASSKQNQNWQRNNEITNKQRDDTHEAFSVVFRPFAIQKPCRVLRPQ